MERQKLIDDLLKREQAVNQKNEEEPLIPKKESEMQRIIRLTKEQEKQDFEAQYLTTTDSNLRKVFHPKKSDSCTLMVSVKKGISSDLGMKFTKDVILKLFKKYGKIL